MCYKYGGPGAVPSVFMFLCLHVCSPHSCLSLPVSGHHGFNDPRSAEEIVLAQVATTKDQYSRRRVCVIAFVQMTLLVMQETYFF